MRRHVVLVTDGDERSALAVVRSLGRAGHEVHVCSAAGRSIAGASRYAASDTPVPPPARSNDDAYVRAMARQVERFGVDVLLPITDASLLCLLPARDRLCARIPFPSIETFRAISDRERLLAAAKGLGVAVPVQSVVRTRDEAERVRLDAIEFPIVIKPARSTGSSRGRLCKQAVLYAADADELRRRLAEVPSGAYPLLLQQRVVGPGVGMFLLVWGGRTVAVFSHRRIREKPPSGGVSVCCEGIPPDPALVDVSRALLDRFAWEGVAMVEWKVDAARGVPFLMEVNARFWGSLQLAIDSGVDFPDLLLAAAAAEPPPEEVRGRPGRRLRWTWGDVDQLLSRLRRSPEALALPPGSPTRWEMLREVLKPWRRGQRDAVFRWGDPLPFVRETVAWLSQGFASATRRESQGECRTLSVTEAA